MQKLISHFKITIFLLLGLPTFAFADDDDYFHSIFEEINNGATISALFTHLDYRETPILNGQELKVKESGFTYGLAIDVRNTFVDRLYTDFCGDFTTGKIQYHGFNKNTLQPTKHRVESNQANVDGNLGIIILDNKYFQLIPYGGFGFRYWKRGSTDAAHTYYNFKEIVGGKINIALSDNLVFSPYAAIGTTFASHVKFTNFAENGTENGRFNFHLGNKVIREAGLEINYKLEQQLFLVVAGSYTQFGYGESKDGLLTDGSGTTNEPNSKTKEIKISIGMKFGFI